MFGNSSISDNEFTKPLALILCEESHMNAIGQDYAETLNKAISEHFRTLAPIRQGADIWESLLYECPSLVLISRTLPDIDPFVFIKTIRSVNYCLGTCFILISATVNESVKRLCENCGISGAVSINSPISESASEIIRIYSVFSENRFENTSKTIQSRLDNNLYFNDFDYAVKVSKSINDIVFLPLGMNIEHKGTKYLNHIIAIQLIDSEKDMKYCYSYAAELFRTTPSAVEKAIRYSIEKAWEIGRPFLQYYLFGNTIDPSKGKPTNKEFVSIALRHIKDRSNREI